MDFDIYLVLDQHVSGSFGPPKNEILDFQAKNFYFNFYCKICKGEKLKLHILNTQN